MTLQTRSLILGLALILMATVTCSLSQGPGGAVTSFFRHLEKGEITEAQGLLAAKVVGRVDASKLRAGLETMAREISAKQGIKNIQVQKEEVQGELATVETLITLGDGSTKADTTKLVKEQGAWKLDVSK